MKKISVLFLLFTLFLLIGSFYSSAEAKTVLIHIKTDLAKDDAQACVAYNVIFAFLSKGYKVNVLIDASAVNTYKKNWQGKDKLSGYKIPDNLRKELARQFNIPFNKAPLTYGGYLSLLHKKGAKFYINGAMLIVSGISREFGDLSRIGPDFFIPVTMKEMISLVDEADKYIVY